MPRSSQLLHPQHQPVRPRPAATVLLLRDTVDGPEVLMTRRSAKASFAPSAYVFPGGAIDAGDAAAHGHATRRPTQGERQLTEAIAAVRESFEELGVLLARHADGAMATADDVATLDRRAPLVEQCRVHDLTLATAEVFALCRWTTGQSRPKRFDTAFFVARMPAGQIPVADRTEQFEPVWVHPGSALEQHAAGHFSMIFPTIRTLQYLRRYADVEAILAACAGEQPLWDCCSRGGLVGGKEKRFMTQDAPYGELALVSPDGFVLHDLDWQSEHPVPLLKNVARLTAPNPSFMTGPGTNSYLVGDTASGYVVIDPGPADAPHLQRLFGATGGDIRAIVCTHSHPDHSPGARPLQALCAKPPPILGLPSAPTARANSVFTPNRALADGERIVLSGNGVTHTLRVIHTPGHAANHLCLVLEEDGLLFSGDHILNGSTTVIDAPDGNMTAYLASLDKLEAACRADGIDFILPAHGYVLGDALGVIARLRAHRLEREAKVRAAMHAKPDGTPDDWVALAYDDVPPRVWPVAKRSLLAHVERLRAEGAGGNL